MKKTSKFKASFIPLFLFSSMSFADAPIKIKNHSGAMQRIIDSVAVYSARCLPASISKSTAKIPTPALKATAEKGRSHKRESFPPSAFPMKETNYPHTLEENSLAKENNHSRPSLSLEAFQLLTKKKYPQEMNIEEKSIPISTQTKKIRKNPTLVNDTSKKNKIESFQNPKKSTTNSDISISSAMLPLRLPESTALPNTTNRKVYDCAQSDKKSTPTISEVSKVTSTVTIRKNIEQEPISFSQNQAHKKKESRKESALSAYGINTSLKPSNASPQKSLNQGKSTPSSRVDNCQIISQPHKKPEDSREKPPLSPQQNPKIIPHGPAPKTKSFLSEQAFSSQPITEAAHKSQTGFYSRKDCSKDSQEHYSAKKIAKRSQQPPHEDQETSYVTSNPQRSLHIHQEPSSIKMSSSNKKFLENSTPPKRVKQAPPKNSYHKIQNEQAPFTGYYPSVVDTSLKAEPQAQTKHRQKNSSKAPIFLHQDITNSNRQKLSKDSNNPTSTPSLNETGNIVVEPNKSEIYNNQKIIQELNTKKNLERRLENPHETYQRSPTNLKHISSGQNKVQDTSVSRDNKKKNFLPSKKEETFFNSLPPPLNRVSTKRPTILTSTKKEKTRSPHPSQKSSKPDPFVSSNSQNAAIPLRMTHHHRTKKPKPGDYPTSAQLMLSSDQIKNKNSTTSKNFEEEQLISIKQNPLDSYSNLAQSPSNTDQNSIEKATLQIINKHNNIEILNKFFFNKEQTAVIELGASSIPSHSLYPKGQALVEFLPSKPSQKSQTAVVELEASSIPSHSLYPKGQALVEFLPSKPSQKSQTAVVELEASSIPSHSLYPKGQALVEFLPSKPSQKSQTAIVELGDSPTSSLSSHSKNQALIEFLTPHKCPQNQQPAIVELEVPFQNNHFLRGRAEVEYR